jgi:hypothetical protein
MFARVAVAKTLSQCKTATTVRVGQSEYSAQQSKSAQTNTSNLPKFSWSFCEIATHAPSEPNQPNSGRCDGSRATKHAGSLSWPMQAKLEVGAVEDPLEREADQVAEKGDAHAGRWRPRISSGERRWDSEITAQVRVRRDV